MRKRVALGSAFLLAAAALAAAEPRLDVALEPTSATVGDPVAATLTLRLDAADSRARASFPDWSRGWGELEVLDAGAVERRESANGAELVQRLKVAAFRVGEIAAPTVAIGLDGASVREVRSAPATLEIRSVLPADEPNPAPRPPSPARKLPLSPAFYATVAALATAALAAAWALRRKTAAALPVPLVPPLEEFERALAALGGAEPAAGHATLSLALRRFLGRSLDLPAPAWSTSELARRLDRRDLDAVLVQRAARLLREIDRIKFARQPADAPALERRIAEAREIARALDRDLHPPAVESAA